MKFQMKLLSLAVMGLALSAPVAHAAIDAGSTNGNGELFFSLWSDNGTVSTADDVSYTRDLGVGINSFTTQVTASTLNAPQITAGYTQAFAANALLTSFINAIPAGGYLSRKTIDADTQVARIGHIVGGGDGAVVRPQREEQFAVAGIE